MVTSVEKKKLKTWQIVLIVLGGIILLSAIFGSSSEDESDKDSLINSIPESSAKEKLTILSDELDYTDYGSLIITGTAKNTAGKDLSYCSLDAKFYDSDGAVIGTSLDNINNLDKDETWKFQIMYIGTDSYNVDTYKIELGSCW
ncbi:FxLYD domain-containing protein [Candidatus Pacearchaeota archaeon]|jgi:hypothetical protein|nr:FxLYD domain-containing protein [Candidatus Pacearchaeota archaeon]